MRGLEVAMLLRTPLSTPDALSERIAHAERLDGFNASLATGNATLASAAAAAAVVVIRWSKLSRSYNKPMIMSHSSSRPFRVRRET